MAVACLSATQIFPLAAEASEGWWEKTRPIMFSDEHLTRDAAVRIQSGDEVIGDTIIFRGPIYIFYSCSTTR